MCVCMYVFIKLHITTQSGPVILVILCHSHVCMYVCMYGQHFQQSMDQPGMVANSFRGHMNRENIFSLSPFRA